MREQQESLRAAVEAVGQFRTAQPEEEATIEEAEEQPTEDLEAAEEETEEVEDSEEESEDEDSEDTFEIKHNGVVHKVTQEELQELASKGFDYTKKSQEISERVKTEAKKLAEEQTVGLQAERKRILEATEIVERLYNSPVVSEEQLQKLLDDGETEEYTRLKHQDDKRRQLIDATKAERNKILTEQQKEQETLFKQYAAEQAEILVREVPDLKNQENVQQLVKHAKSLGFSEEELSSAADARALKALWESYQYQQLAKGGVPKKKIKSPKVTKSKRSNPSKKAVDRSAFDSKRNKLKQTNSIRDAASIIGDLRKR